MNNKFLNALKNFFMSGKTQLVLKILIFINGAFFIGLWIGIKIFFPGDFILSKINEQLFIKDYGMSADDVDVSILGDVSFSDGTILQKGEKSATFGNLTFSPALTDLISGRFAGKIYLEDINAQGGKIKATFESGETPCYSFSAEEAPLSLLKPFFSTIFFTGTVGGEGNFCIKEKKIGGNVELLGDDVVFRGKIPTLMGDFDIGKIILGKIDLLAEITENRLEIRRFSVKGIFELNIGGKIALNIKNFMLSRVDLEVKISIPDMKKVLENPKLNILVSQLSQYKGEKENSYAFILRGLLNNPQTTKFQKEQGGKKKSASKKNKKFLKPSKSRGSKAQPEKATAKPAVEKEEKQNEEKLKEEAAKKRAKELEEERMKEEAAKKRAKELEEERIKEERNKIQEENEKIKEEQKKMKEELQKAREEARQALEEAKMRRKEAQSEREEAEERRSSPPKESPEVPDSENGENHGENGNEEKKNSDDNEEE